MKTDPSLYEFLATGTEAFRVLTGGLTLPGAYRFTSLTLKGIERRLDGIYEPDGRSRPRRWRGRCAPPWSGCWNAGYSNDFPL